MILTSGTSGFEELEDAGREEGAEDERTGGREDTAEDGEEEVLLEVTSVEVPLEAVELTLDETARLLPAEDAALEEDGTGSRLQPVRIPKNINTIKAIAEALRANRLFVTDKPTPPMGIFRRRILEAAFGKSAIQPNSQMRICSMYSITPESRICQLIPAAGAKVMAVQGSQPSVVPG